MINLLAISGKIGSGKDTVAKIIQYLIYENSNPEYPFDKDIEEYLLSDSFLFTPKGVRGLINIGVKSGWEIRKFGGKLKQIVALLIGCTVEQLEDQEFKSSPLGKEWRRFYYYHYKLRTDSNNGRVSPYFSTYEEAMLYNFPKLDGVPIWGKDSLWIEEEELTPRLLLQLIGTEGLRNLIHPNSHINGLFADYIGHCNSQFCLGTKQCPDEYITKDCNAVYPNWICTDCRFPNEVQAIKERNGIVIRINRRIYKNTIPNNEVLNSPRPLDLGEYYKYDKEQDVWCDELVEQSTHESETALDNSEFDYVIDNNKDIPHLIEEVRKMLVHFKIL